MRKLLLFSCLIFLLSCKKERLDGEYSILVGQWELAYVVETTVSTNWGTTHDTTFAINIQDQYTLEFLKEGKLSQIKNGESTQEDRIVFEVFIDEPASSEYSKMFVIRLNNADDDAFGGTCTSDKMSASKAHVQNGFDDIIENGYKVVHKYIYFKQ